jgi:two-component system NtrC family sensor kinase
MPRFARRPEEPVPTGKGYILMRLGLMVKFSIISAIVLLFTMGVFTFFNISMLKRAFMDVYINDVDRLSETIIRTTHNAMLAGHTDDAYQAMGQAGANEDIKNIRLIDKNGIVRFSLLRSEVVNKPMDKNSDPSCRTCHMDHTPKIDASTMDRSRIFVDADGEEVLGLTKGIYNQPGCSAAKCHYHPSGANLLGVLDIVVSMRGILSRMDIYRNNMFVELIFLILALALCMYLLLGKLIIQPVKTLLEHTRALSRGEWKLIENAPYDEIGELAESFNEMTVNLKKAREDSEKWATTLESRVEERTRQIQEMQSVLIRSEKLASLGELSAGIAHELNNPLTGIVLHASILNRNAVLSPDMKEDLTTIMNEADRCARIVKNLLDFSRKTEPQKAMKNVNDTIDLALALVENLAVFQDIEIVREYSPDLPELLMDAGQMEQVFVNMFVNASQAMEDGGKLTIKTDLESEGSSVAVRIEDTGSGIRKELLGKIFDPFFTTKGQGEGTGLGLNISRNLIVQKHFGEISVKSKPGSTCFTVRLPIDLKPSE